MRLVRLLALLLAPAAAAFAAGPAEPSSSSAALCASTLQGLRACLRDVTADIDAVDAADTEAAVARCLAKVGGIAGSCLAPVLERQPLRRQGDDAAPDDAEPSACRTAIEAAAGTAKGLEALLASGRVALTLAVASQVFTEFNQTGDPADLMYLFYGHDVSLGSPDNCKAIPGFHYCWATTDLLPFAKAGVCVPDTCSLADLAALVEEIGDSTGNPDILALDLHHIQGQCGDFRFPAVAGTYVMLALVLLLAGLVVGGTWMDSRRLRQKEDAEDEAAAGGYSRLAAGEAGGRAGGDKRKKEAEKAGRGSGGGSSEEKDALLDDVEKAAAAAAANGNGGANGHAAPASAARPRQQPSEQSLVLRILSCFSLYRTLPSLLGPARPGAFNALDGVRVFSMSWVVLGHIYAFPATLTGYTNEETILPPDGILGTYAGQALFSAEFSVDTFFCIGAFVAAYMLTAHLTKARQPPSPGAPPKPVGCGWIPSLYLHRYMRLTPLYFFVLGCYYFLMRVVDSGPWWGLLQRDYDMCAKYVWTNLLYINTLYPWTATLDQCYPVSWYMSVDFQLFLLLPFLCLAYVHNKRLGYLLPLLLWTASTVYSYILGYVYNTSQFAMSLDITEANRYQRDYYFKAWTRAPVYMLGILFAFLWLDFTQACERGADHWLVNMFTSNRRRRMTAPIATLLGLALFLLGLCAYGAQPAYHDGGLDKFWDVAYLALSRSAWCVGLLLLCFLLFNGFSCLGIKALLENRVMAVLSRLTFAAYLIHPAMIFLVVQDQPLPQHYSTIWISFTFLGMLTTVFAFSALAFLLVEKPLANLERALLSGGGSKKGK